MNQTNNPLIALDVGEKRIGVAASDGIVQIARPLETVLVDGTELDRIMTIIRDEKAKEVIVGYPRNQSGEPTQQTSFVEAFKQRLEELVEIPVIFQDESLTSVLAEDRLKSYAKPYEKGDVDKLAAALILQDYLEQ